VPVVGSRAGGLPEVVREGETGALRDVGDIEGMSEAAIRILSDNSIWESMSRCAALDARARFSRDAVVAQYEALYQDAMKANG
jgi:glycosyltransferase involved in cell wall biosynthesis